MAVHLSCHTAPEATRYWDIQTVAAPGWITHTHARVQWGMCWQNHLQAERLSWGWWFYCLNSPMLNCFSAASPSYEQSGAVSSQGATQTLPALRSCKHQKALLGAAHWVLFKCCLANHKWTGQGLWHKWCGGALHPCCSRRGPPSTMMVDAPIWYLTLGLLWAWVRAQGESLGHRDPLCVLPQEPLQKPVWSGSAIKAVEFVLLAPWRVLSWHTVALTPGSCMFQSSPAPGNPCTHVLC